ncbi:MAG: carbohydrate ABC transporter permease, partial [Phycisphaerae bacterium]
MRRTGRIIGLLFGLALLGGAAAMIWPYLYMVSSSFKMGAEYEVYKRDLLPPRLSPFIDRATKAKLTDDSRRRYLRQWGIDRSEPLLKNYTDAFRFGRVHIYLLNSLLYALAATAAQLLLNSLAAYAFARMHFPGRDLLFGLLLSTMMLPPAVLLVPQFLVAQALGLVDTFWGVVVPGFAGAFGIFMLRQFFLNIPRTLEDAAMIDGCSRLGILFRIVLPVAKPALVTLGLFIFLGMWNSFIWPLVVLSDWD